jgi:GST-like protein
MIDLYFAPTPNTWKVSIMLEECGLGYQVISLDLGANAQKQPEFLAINPNGRVPAIVDHDAAGGAQPVFESGAILIYLAEKTGKFLAPAGPARVEAFEWLMWQMGGLGPMAGQANHFLRVAPPGNDYAIQRYVNETARLYAVLDGRLARLEYLAGNAYSIADMACWGWIWFHRMQRQQLSDFPNLPGWFNRISERPAVGRARAIGLENLPETTRASMAGPFYDAP